MTTLQSAPVQPKTAISARINLMKLLLLFPVLLFHSFVSFVGAENISDDVKLHTWNNYIKLFGNEFFGATGFLITCLSFFIYGYTFKFNRNKTWSKYLFKFLILAICVVASQIDFYKNPNDDGFFTWNLYSFILSIFIILYGLKKIFNAHPRQWFYLCAVAFTLSPLLASPIRNQLHLILQQALFPTEVANIANSWFLIPWVFAPLMFYCLGILHVQDLKLKELRYFMLLILLAASTYFWNVQPLHYPFSLDLNLFYKSFFWQSISLDLIKLFLFGLSLSLLCSKYLVSLENNFILRKLKYLQWCRHFWFCYILHLGIKDIMIENYNQIFIKEYLFNHAWLFLFLATEILAQLFFASLIFYRFMLRGLITKLSFRHT